MKIRILSEGDSLEALTDLIHRAYQQLADLGFRYWGTHQTVEDTAQRVAIGACFVALVGDQIVGTVVLCDGGKTAKHTWYLRPEVTVFNQFAVDPRYQRRGVGTAMMKHLEAVAARRGLEELACDTAEGAIHLVEWYRRMGYREVGRADWKDTNYQSLILSKRLNGG